MWSEKSPTCLLEPDISTHLENAAFGRSPRRDAPGYRFDRSASLKYFSLKNHAFHQSRPLI
jgi:hypothetical protein